jgi:hypothetical protein
MDAAQTILGMSMSLSARVYERSDLLALLVF